MKYIIAILGFIALVVGVVLLVLAQFSDNLFTEERLLGGASRTQEELVAQSFGAQFNDEVPPDLPIQTDEGLSSVNQLGAQPEFSSEALNDISSIDSAEQEAFTEINSLNFETAPEAQAQSAEIAAAVPDVQSALNANVPVDAQTEVELVPLDNVTSASPVDPFSGQGGAGGLTGGVEQRYVELEWPTEFRVSGSGTVRLTLQVVEGGNIEAVAEVEDNAILATPIILTDRYDTHRAEVTARLVAPDFEVDLITSGTQSMERGQEVTWRWSLNAPDNSGEFTMTMAIDINWVPEAAGAVPVSRSIWGQALRVDVNHVIAGISVPQASILGVVLAVGGFLSQIPFLGEVLGFLFGRRGRKKRNKKRR